MEKNNFISVENISIADISAIFEFTNDIEDFLFIMKERPDLITKYLKFEKCENVCDNIFRIIETINQDSLDNGYVYFSSLYALYYFIDSFYVDFKTNKSLMEKMTNLRCTISRETCEQMKLLYLADKKTSVFQFLATNK